MKKFLAIILITVLVVSVAGCGSNGPNDPSPDESIEITLPVSLFDDIEEIDQHTYTEEQGFTKVVINEDGSVTLTMTKVKHKELLAEMSTGIEETFTELIEAEFSSYIKEITHTPNYRTVFVDVDKGSYEASWFDLTPFVVGFSSILYQIFAGEDLHCEVIIRDVDTGEIISTTIIPED